MNAPVGIDSLNLYGSTLAVDNEMVAVARGLERYLDHVQIRRRSIAPLVEDPITLAVNAARPLVEEAGPDAFELLIVATESGVDLGKPISSYVHRHLGLPSRCRNLEAKHACYAGTAALQLATAWVRSGERPGKRALVITTDLPGRQFGEPAEFTPGTGAVALSVGAEPRVLALDPWSGYASREIYDTARPTPTTHWVDEALSLGAYLDLFEMAWEEYRRARRDRGGGEELTHVVYHMPLVRLVREAHRILEESEGEEWSEERLASSFERMVRPSLAYCEEVGNIFSGTLYAGLAALLDSAACPSAGARIGLYSYGSGSCAEFYSGVVGPAARETVSRHGIAAHIAERRPLTLEEYERTVLDHEASVGRAEFRPGCDLPAGLYAQAYEGRDRLVLARVENHYRHYSWS